MRKFVIFAGVSVADGCGARQQEQGGPHSSFSLVQCLLALLKQILTGTFCFRFRDIFRIDHVALDLIVQQHSIVHARIKIGLKPGATVSWNR